MAVSEEQKRSPANANQKSTAVVTESNGQNMATLFSPRFKSAAAMAGWDEEALLLATLVVEDTPDRDLKQRKRFVLNSKTPPTNSRRKRRAQTSEESIPVAVLDLDEAETPTKDSGKKKKEEKTCDNEGRKEGGEVGNELSEQKCGGATSSSSALPCIDKLREELSCAICLEICFEPSTTPCGHSFCRKCLRSAADKCGKKCPKCRQLISNGRSCTVNTVLWNTIQLLFPQEVESRKAAGALNARQQAQCLSPETAFYSNLSNGNTLPVLGAPSRSSRRSGATTQEDEDAALARRLQREINGQSQGTRTRVHSNSRNQTLSSSARVMRASRRGGISSQDEDAALALRLQRQEFMQTYRGSQEQSSSNIPSSSLARANLRAMASRAMNIRIRDRRL